METTLWVIKVEIFNLVSRARYWNNLQIRSEWNDSFIVKIRLPYEYHGMWLIRDMNCLSFARFLGSTPDVGEVHVAHPVSFLCCVVCFVCLRPMSCVPNVDRFFWIVQFWVHFQFSLTLLTSLPWWYNVNVRLWTAQQYHLCKQC